MLNFSTEDTSESKAFYIKGFQEVLFSVRNLEESVNFFTNATAWKEIYNGTVSNDTIKAWNLSPNCKANESLIINEGDNQGFLRLISFKNVKQKNIRSNSQSWDTGGIYDIDLRTVDIDSSIQEFKNASWSGFNDKLEYQFDKFHISEILLKGQEDIVIALIQRYKPVLEGYPNLKKLSQIFNSSQVVKSMEFSKDFYINKLGFKIYMEHNLKGSDTGDNLFGLPKNIYKNLERKICILSPEGNNFGSVELIELVGLEGNDFSALAIPPNLGILMLRFPVKNIKALESHFIKNKIEIKSSIYISEIKPYGNCQSLAIQSPDGAWLEFIEII